MPITVLFFGACRERAQAPSATFADAAGLPLGDLRARIAARFPDVGPILTATRIAVNQEFAADDHVLADGDEVALIPPVAGGSGLGPFAVTAEPIDPAAVSRAVLAPEVGAVVSFVGTVRDHNGPHDVSGLEYEAYGEMASRVFDKIGREIADRWPGSRVTIVHRTGRLAIGDVAVAIAVGSPHRDAAFAGCRHAIERIKEDAPIWKKESRTDGTVWIGLGS